ncbi:MAG TPA: NAD(P)-binding domain-containing protein [Solirubrobacteraceae bacterium]
MTTETVIIGAGQAGLSLSRYLTLMRRNHVVLERGNVGARWRSERWQSLRLLTPNWLNALDGSTEHGDRDGYLASAGFADYLERYARRSAAPVRRNVNVVGVERGPRGFRIRTDAGVWHTRNVVVATGYSDVPQRPRAAAAAPRELHQIDAAAYRAPSALSAGGVLLVGAGPSGQQIAAELRRAGREVVLSVGGHTRMPRRYRGRDIFHWLAAIGDLDLTIDELPDRVEAIRSPSLALSGANGGEDLDLGVLHSLGVGVAGRLAGFDGRRALFADDLETTFFDADYRMRSLLDRIDAHIDAEGDELPLDQVPDVQLPPGPRALDLAASGVSTIIWATGYRRDYHWLHVPVLDGNGEIEHRRGITPEPGLFALGLKFQHRKSSHQIGGVGRDARFIASHIAGTIPLPARRRARGLRAAAA